MGWLSTSSQTVLHLILISEKRVRSTERPLRVFGGTDMMLNIPASPLDASVFSVQGVEKQFVSHTLLNLCNYIYFFGRSEWQSHIYPTIKASVDYQLNTSLGRFFKTCLPKVFVFL